MPKLLADFLLEQQEPFALEVYLVERGYPKGLTLHNSAKCVVPNCSYFVRAVLSQFVVANASGGRRNFLIGKSKRRPEDGFCAASTSCSECDAGGSHCSESAIRRFVKCGNCFLEGEVDDADTNSKLKAGEEDCKQLSPVSVFGGTDSNSDQDSPIHYKQCDFKRQEDEQGSSSTSQCRLKQPRRNFIREVNPYDQYIINKMVLQQREHLLIDCTQELIEKYRKREQNRDEIKAMLGAEEIWRHIWIWSQDSINGSSIVHLLHSDLLASAHEWNAVFEQQKFEISIEIENAILENVVDEIITWLAW